MAAHI
jgi:hypothetical protein